MTTTKKISEEAPEFDELKVSWFTRAREVRTVEEMRAFVAELVEGYEHDYGTICHAMTAAAMAGIYALEHSPSGGITGFQASHVAHGFLREFMHLKHPFMVLDYGHLLYPHYEMEFRAIPVRVAEWLKAEAQKELEKAEKAADVGPEDGAYHVRANGGLLEHWRRLAAGELPFGLTVDHR